MDTRTHVALVTRIFVPEVAAASFRLSGMVRAVAARGHRVSVITTTPPQPADGQDAPQPVSFDGDVSVSRWPALRNRDGQLRGYLPYMSFDIPAALRLIATPRPSVVVNEPPPTTGAVVATICRLRQLPHVYYAADVWSDASATAGAPNLVVRVVRALESYAYRSADLVVCVTDQLEARVKELGAKYTVLVRNGIDTDVFTADGPRPADAPVGRYLLYAGTASPWQGADIFIRAFKKVRDALPDVHLVFLGQGAQWDELVECAAGDERIHFLPTAAPAVAAAWQRAASATLVSLAPDSGVDAAYPTKILSSLSCGTPVVYCGPGPARADIEEHNLGWVCDYDADELASTLTEAVNASPDRPHLRRWVIDNRSLVKTGEAVADAILAVAAAGRRGRRARRKDR